jgi:hypothetical protein
MYSDVEEYFTLYLGPIARAGLNSKKIGPKKSFGFIKSGPRAL